MGQNANMAHVVAFFISFQNNVTVKLPFWANTGIIGDSKDNTIYW
jgi:hypothetical protein